MTERQRQILDAAASLFRHYGYAKTTVADIARAAQVGVGTVYLEFASKDEIGAALSERSHRKVLGEMRKAVDSGEDFQTRFRAVLIARTRGLCKFASAGAHGLDLVRCGCDAAEDVHRRHREEEADLMCELIRSATSARVFECDDPAETASLVLHIFDSLAPWSEPGGIERLDVERALRGITNLVLNGLLNRSGHY